MAGGTISLAAALGLLVLFVVVWCICLNGLRVALNRYAPPLRPSPLTSLPAAAVPGVSIIRPLCGLDNNMYNTLESVMRLDYPRYEVVFAVQDEKDEALPVVRMVMEKYPGVKARIVVNPAKVGVNPKVNNLLEPFRVASYDILWVLDATIAVTPGVLGRMVDAFVSRGASARTQATRGTGDASADIDIEAAPLIADEDRPAPARGDVGLVHQVPVAVVYQRAWGSRIEQAYLNSTHAKMYLSINNVAIESCVVGKSNMYSRANIASLTTPSPTLLAQADPPTGLAGFGPFMAEDNMIALSLWHELGLKHAMTPDVALDYLAPLTMRDYIARRARWIRVRKHMTLSATLMEPFTESLLAGVYAGWALRRLCGIPMWLTFVVNLAAWLSVDLAVRRALTRNTAHIGPKFELVEFVAAWAAREILALPIWLYAVTGSTVVWRGNRYRILASGECALPGVGAGVGVGAGGGAGEGSSARTSSRTSSSAGASASASTSPSTKTSSRQQDAPRTRRQVDRQARPRN